MRAPWLRGKHLTNYTSFQLHFIILSFVSIMIDVCSIRSRPKEMFPDRPVGKGISLLHLYLRLDSDKIQGHILTIHRLWLMTHSPRVWWGSVQIAWTTCVETGRGRFLKSIKPTGREFFKVVFPQNSPKLSSPRGPHIGRVPSQPVARGVVPGRQRFDHHHHHFTFHYPNI